MHLVASRQTGTATSILRALLATAGKDIRLKPDGVSSLQKPCDRKLSIIPVDSYVSATRITQCRINAEKLLHTEFITATYRKRNARFIFLLILCISFRGHLY